MILWALVGPNNQICGPEFNGKFTTMFFMTEGDAIASLKELDVPNGTVVRPVNVTIEPIAPMRKAG